MLQTSRRAFFAGLGAMLAAPAIVHAGNLMPVKAWRDPHEALMELLARRIADAEKTLYEAINETLYGVTSWTLYSGYEVLNIQPSGVYAPHNYIMRPASSTVQIDAR